jgi:hypothetical protein
MKRYFLLILTLGLLAFSNGMKKVEVAEGIKAQVPEEFRQLTEQEIASRYEMRNRPLAVFADPTMQVDFTANFTTVAWRETDLELMQQFYRSSIYSLYDDVEVISEGVKTINKREYITFEFQSVVKGDPKSFKHSADVRKYHYIMYTVEEGKMLIFSFACPARLQNKWQPTAQEIMQSIKVKKIKDPRLKTQE